MDHYLDIRLLPDPEFAPLDLMDALYAKLHRALVAARSEGIGVSFPQVRANGPGLGDVLRLHGSKAHLTDLMAVNWLTGMRDQVAASPVQAVPASCTRYRVVSRVQAKSNPERERRRLMRRKGLDDAQARAKIPDAAAETLDLPYVRLRSQSTAQTFHLFIRHGVIVDHSAEGAFNAYGLSPAATVPWF